MKPFTTFATLLLSAISILQLLRTVMAWPVTVNGWEVPVWTSGIACVVAGVTAAMLWRESRR
ncbi:hypothetical protein [Lysobacter sp. Root494]|uniref:hypothetical protein n=1 Tax=Lysobacter sp. Root494 TaxID=1736549 RepID=UPI0006FA2506|nr:hypothetical protein [Lysobacter sp. Root494]KQY51845.1 hypothetical protein ASD14_03980 [Lysobacter sp. Root494]